MLLCTYQEVDNSKHWQLQMLVSMWSNHSLLVGMQNGSATLEDSLGIRFLIKWNILYCHFTCHNHHTLLVIYLKELTAYVHTEAAHRCFSSVQLLSCVRLYDPMDCSRPGILVHHQLPEPTQTHVYQVGDAIQPSHPLSSPSPAFNPSQHQSLSQ